MRLALLLPTSPLIVLSALHAETVELDPIVAHANRILANGSNTLNAVAKLELQERTPAEFRDVSDALQSYPGIATYRRTHPATAHPTTQGVRLRNVGANASSRSLVLHDGVPQNDPFGGWIYWHRYDLAQLESISLHPSGVGEIWGNMASGGLLNLVSKPSAPGEQSFKASFGSSDRIDLSANSATQLGENSVFDFGIRHFESDGFHTLIESQRGPLDEKASSKADSLNSRLRWSTGDLWNSQLSFRYLDEQRGNGTPTSVNSTEAFDVSYITERDIDAQNARLNLNLYFQDRDFQNVFASVASDRASERPALDQYDTPAQSFGGALVYRQEGDAKVLYTGGIDFRLIDGSVNERYRNLGNGFTRDRYAGGKQEFYALFGGLTSEVSDKNRISATFRVEEVKQSDGKRIETNTENNTVIRDESYTDRSSTILSGNLSWRHHLTNTAASNLSLFSGYRAPTLNELYRPFRVRNDITEANPLLANERHQGIELSFSQSIPQSQDGQTSDLRFSAFHYEAEEMIANALYTTQSGFDPRFGFIPSGGSGSARTNLDQSTVSGIELHARHAFSKSFEASLTGVYSESEINADELSEFEGNAFPHSAPWKATASLRYSPSDQLQLAANYRWYDRSWENLANTRRLGATSDLSLAAHYQVDRHHSVSVSITNALDQKNVSGIASNGLITIDEPREILFTYSWKK